jgi:nitroimidazol reductase NimA-like FMN-containing flavoprotein (pyridoxamine 5'-phosphate oxidase superfamily)
MSSYGTDVLDPSECQALLATQAVGRVAVQTALGPAIMPVLFGVLDSDIVFRTAPGEKLIAAALHRVVAFETDAFDVAARTGWSVDVVGPAEELVNPDDLERAEALGLDPWAGGAVRDRYVRIRADRVTGRRVRTGANV